MSMDLVGVVMMIAIIAAAGVVLLVAALAWVVSSDARTDWAESRIRAYRSRS